MNRERNLQEFAFSTCAGAVIALVLCMMLPGIETKSDTIAFFAMFWFMSIYGVWSVIDWGDRI